MIEAKEIATEGAVVECPHCRRALLTAFAHDQTPVFDGYLFGDGDTVPIFHELTEKQREAPGDWYAALVVGDCPFCFEPFFAINAAFIDTEPDDEFRDVYFYRNGERGEETNYLAQEDGQTWIVSLFETPLGPMLEHQFGPFADTYGDWIGPAGVTACTPGGPWAFAVDLLLKRWDDLRAMNQLFASSPTRPMPKERSTAAPRLAPDLDDDIPF